MKEDYSKEDPHWVIHAIAELINPAGRIAITGVWPPKDPQGVAPSLKEGMLLLPWGKLFGKNVQIVMGRDDDERWNGKLRDMILTGAAKPRQVVSHRLPLDAAPEAFARFDAREQGFIKVVLKPKRASKERSPLLQPLLWHFARQAQACLESRAPRC